MPEQKVTQREIGLPSQDEYTAEEAAKVLKSLSRGKYELDIGPDGCCKFSRVSRRWVQKEDLS